MHLFHFAIIAAFAVTMSACSATYIVRCKDSDQLAIHDSLYFGTAKPNGVVSSEDWARFLENTVTPLFPRGLTSSRASGQWRNSDGEIVREDSHVLQLLHPDDAPTEKAIRELVDRYKSQFQQEAVTAHTFPYVRVVLVSRFKLKQHIFKDHPISMASTPVSQLSGTAELSADKLTRTR